MKHSKSIALIAAGLVAGIVLGSVGLAAAAPASTTTTPAPQTTGVLGACIGMGQAIRGAGARLIDVLADLTGLSTTDIQAKRAAGESIADIAKSEGVDPDDVVAKALEARKALLDQKVADGTITQEQADAAYAQMQERLTERVTTTATGRPSWAGQGQGLGGGRGAGRGGNGAGFCGGCQGVSTAQ
ncbi:MAG: hypothetical protein QMC94_04720 [Anaerosomatales bacterium]|nr:hypothetical protein [Anaerosomatales bacterium]